MPDQSEHVRVREGEWEYTVERRLLVDSDRLEVLEDKNPYRPNGKPAPPKPVTPLGTPAPGSKQERQRAAKKTSEAKSPGVDAGQTSATPDKEN